MDEVKCLLTLVIKYKNVIASKETGLSQWAKKKATWDKLAMEFNAQGVGPYREADSLQNKYRQLLVKSRKQTKEKEKKKIWTKANSWDQIKEAKVILESIEVPFPKYGKKEPEDADDSDPIVVTVDPLQLDDNECASDSNNGYESDEHDATSPILSSILHSSDKKPVPSSDSNLPSVSTASKLPSTPLFNLTSLSSSGAATPSYIIIPSTSNTSNTSGTRKVLLATGAPSFRPPVSVTSSIPNGTPRPTLSLPVTPKNNVIPPPNLKRKKSSPVINVQVGNMTETLPKHIRNLEVREQLLQEQILLIKDKREQIREMLRRDAEDRLKENVRRNRELELKEREVVQRMRLERERHEADMGRRSNPNPWIDAFTDTRAAINTLPSCMTLADIAGDKENRLVIADLGDAYSLVKLKVYKGTHLESEIPFSDLPCAITAIYTDFNVPHIPALAVAAGAQVYLYKNQRPFFKFCLPGEEENSLESDLWKTASTDVAQLYKLLTDLQQDLGYSNLSTLSQDFLRLKSDAERAEYVATHKHVEVKKQTVITCMTPVSKSLPDDKSISCLVLATESSKIYILDPEAFTIVKEFKCPDVAIHLVAFGIFVVDYTIILASRSGAIYLIKPNETRVLTELSAFPVGLVLVNDTFVVACMDGTLQGFGLKGKKQWTIKLPGQPMCMTLVALKFLSLNLVAVSCQVSRNDAKSGSLFLYSGPQLVHALSYPEPLSGVIFGQFGLEEHALVTVSVMGVVSAKLLRRTATFGLTGEGGGDKWWATGGPQEPSQIQLMVPKKSKIFIEQTLRERADYKVMHGIFQKSLLQLSADSSQMYLNALTQCSVSQQDALKMTHQVLGLGPRLKLQISIQNISKDKVLTDMGLTFLADPSVHDVQRKYIQVPVLVPGLLVCLESDILCVASMSSAITVLVFIASKVVLSSDINMPSDYMESREMKWRTRSRAETDSKTSVRY
ncbi:hypothetical protein M8J76_013923 [Diaphorina citri]|nr:hypothetical protein M8J76_013923 [Diaphorina citri]